MDIESVKLPPQGTLPAKHFQAIKYIKLPEGPGAMPSHLHPDVDELVFIVKGEGHLTLPQRVYDLHAGDICAIRPNTVHCVDSDAPSDFEYSSIWLDPDFIEKNFFTGCFNRVVDGGDLVKALFPLAFSKLQSIDTGVNLQMSPAEWLSINLLTSHALELFRDTLELDDQVVNQRMFEIWLYIRDNSTQKITLPGLAEMFSMSESSLSRQFQKAYNSSPINFLIDIRILNAATMLSDTDMSISEISEAVGYDNVSYFTRLFTRRRGCSPMEFRRTALRSNDKRAIFRTTYLDLDSLRE